MLVYPQLESGALAQYPVLKTRRTRTVVNRTADGSTLRLADPAVETTEWLLRYSDLSDAEAASLQEFFEAAEGSLRTFTFVDPAGNLLAWSERFESDAWQKDPLLTIDAGIADPRGDSGGWRLANRAGGVQEIAQTIAAPGYYQYCFSAYVRSAAPTMVTLSIAGQAAECAASSRWTRVSITSSGAAGAASVRFGIALGAGDTVEVFGPQVEAQSAASAYMVSTRGGVYEGAYLGEDTLTISRTNVNRNSCTVKIIHANHL
ncbi:MAG: hypothetical protein ABI759_25485 [Candidatus Solibacter sp.]